MDPQHLVYIKGKPFVTFEGVLTLAHTRGRRSITMALEELTGYPYEISGPAVVDGVAYGFHGTDTPPTGATYLCDGLDARHRACYLVLMDLPEPPEDLPDGWTATAYAMTDDWASEDGTWITKALCQQSDGSWVFASTQRA